jgi:phage-related protein
MKPLEFLGSSRDDLRAMPDAVRHDIGFELMRVQFGGEPKSQQTATADIELAKARYRMIGGKS